MLNQAHVRQLVVNQLAVYDIHRLVVITAMMLIVLAVLLFLVLPRNRSNRINVRVAVHHHILISLVLSATHPQPYARQVLVNQLVVYSIHRPVAIITILLIAIMVVKSVAACSLLH